MSFSLFVCLILRPFVAFSIRVKVSEVNWPHQTQAYRPCTALQVRRILVQIGAFMSLVWILGQAMTSNIPINAATTIMNNGGYRDNIIVKFLMDHILLLSMSALLFGVCVTMAIALCVGAREKKKVTQKVCPSKSEKGGGTARIDQQYEPVDERSFTPHAASVWGSQIHFNSEYEEYVPENQGCRPGCDAFENVPAYRSTFSANNSSGCFDLYENSKPGGVDNDYINVSRADNTCNDGIYSNVPRHY